MQRTGTRIHIHTKHGNTKCMGQLGGVCKKETEDLLLLTFGMLQAAGGILGPSNRIYDSEAWISFSTAILWHPQKLGPECPSDTNLYG